MAKVNSGKKNKQPVVDNSRKALRKQKRLQKKAHRQEHYSKKKTVVEQPKYAPGQFVKRPIESADHKAEVKKKKVKLQPSAQDILSMEREKEIKQANKLKSEMDDRRKDIMVKANEDEDKVIKKLEKQLGLNKSKNKNNYFADDGLDYLLEICDRSTTEQIVAAEKHLAQVDNDSDFEEDLALVTGKKLNNTDRKSKRKHEEGDSDNEINDIDQIDDEDNDIDDSEDQIDDEDDVIDDSEDHIDDEIGDNKIHIDNQDDKIEDAVSNNAGSKQEMYVDEELMHTQGYYTDEDVEDDSVIGEYSEESESEEKTTKASELTDLKSNQTIEKSKTDTKVKQTSKERVIKADDLSKVFSDDEVSHLSDDDVEGLSADEIGDNVSIKKAEKPDVWEDIYGRKRDKDGNIIKEEKGVYVPPHLRNKDSSSDKQLAQLQRQIKSVLNKLAGTNLHWACASIENLYSSNSRHSVNSTLTQLWLEATVAPSMTPDRLVAEHAALVAVLHANIGSEIGAHFLQELVKRFDSMMETPQPVEDKQLDNLVACLAHLYNFKIFDAPLLNDILNRILSNLNEKSIDCALVALRCCGATLRKQAPRQLQQLVQDVQPRAAGLSEGAAVGSRIKFLLEVLMAIKNNNLMKIPNYDPTYQEHLAKITRTIVRKGNYVTPLNISLEDLLKADERGKWWVVGSAWEGTARDSQHSKDASQSVTLTKQDQKLLELARKQRMNTDVRRSIFCVIMAAQDYMDAFEKLQHLGLKAQQEREVVHVLLACCLQEKTYNPYYSVLALKLCHTDRKYQLSIQFAVWDKIKELENQPKQCLTNLAQFLIHLFLEKGLPLSVLKVMQFSELNKHSVRFMRQILLAIIMHEHLPATLEVFHRISKPAKLHMFRESVRLFIQHFLLKNVDKKSSVLSEKDMTILKQRAVEVDKILTSHDSKLKF